jgi:hypothetical protein
VAFQIKLFVLRFKFFVLVLHFKYLCIVTYVEKIAMERYKQVPSSKGMSFMLQYCWKLIEHNEKWKLREQEEAPQKGAMVQLDHRRI